MKLGTADGSCMLPGSGSPRSAGMPKRCASSVVSGGQCRRVPTRATLQLADMTRQSSWRNF